MPTLELEPTRKSRSHSYPVLDERVCLIDEYHGPKDDNRYVVSDPDRMDDEHYIVRLIGQAITVSLETAKLVNWSLEAPAENK